MEPSPLTQQARPESFQQKVVELYQALFQDSEDLDKPEGFWREFFLLKPSKAELRRLLTDLSPDHVLHLQLQTRALFLRAVTEIKAGVEPRDENALDTLTAFLVSLLTKKYTNTSSDIIDVITGLDEIDATLTEFVTAVDGIIRNGRTMQIRQKAIEVVLAIVSGAYKTSLLSYFMHRDFFPSLMKYIQDLEDDSQVFEPFLLLGLLANYNKFEFQNPYRMRLDDFVNEGVVKKIIVGIGSAFSLARDKYVAVQDDLPEEWGLNSALTYLGLGGLTLSKKPAITAPDPEMAKTLFAALPSHSAALLLSTYDFVNANKLFCFNFISIAAAEKNNDSSFSAYLSLTSYLLNHAHRSTRTSLYANLNLTVVRILVEDQVLCKQICSDDSKTAVRLCRQRQPYLPLVKGERILATVLLDIMVDGINHNLRRKLDANLYCLLLDVLLRIVSFLSRSRTHLAYHWSELWRSLLSFIRFLTSYVSDLKTLSRIDSLLDTLVNLIALSLSSGDAFLPSAAEYDDLFYKLVEMGDILEKFRDAYSLNSRPTNSIDTLISVSAHYTELLQSTQAKTRAKNLSPRQVSSVIKLGYETLSISARDDLDAWDRYREADEKAFLKKVARVAVEDVTAWLLELS